MTEEKILICAHCGDGHKAVLSEGERYTCYLDIYKGSEKMVPICLKHTRDEISKEKVVFP